MYRYIEKRWGGRVIELNYNVPSFTNNDIFSLEIKCEEYILNNTQKVF
jgi:hypothetical protein